MRASNALAFLFAVVASNAAAFPANTRAGYANCSSCHVSPTGGGILTPYGRMSASEFLSTWSYENEAEPLHGLVHNYYIPPDSPIQVGGDFRYLYIHSIPDRQFYMQREGEIAAALTKEFTVVVSGGFYPDDTGKYIGETRRNYVMFSPNEHVTLRAGKFYPAYGILTEDHTVATRAGIGWDEGQETYNLEASYKNEYGEVFLTPMLGSDNYTELTPNQGYVFRTDDKGAALRIAAYLGKSSQVGLSALYSLHIDPDQPSSRYYGGPFAIVGITQSLYLLSEVDAAKLGASPMQVFSFNQVGYEVWKGIHLQAQYQRRGADNEYDTRLQLFPRPHFELVAEYCMTKTENHAVFLAHYYF